MDLLSFVVIISTYVPTMLKLKRLKNKDSLAVRRLAFVPGAFLILRLPSFARVLLDFVDQFRNSGDFTCVGFLSFLQSVGDPSQGFINGVAYVVGSKKTRDTLFSCSRSGEKDRPSNDKMNDHSNNNSNNNSDSSLEAQLIDNENNYCSSVHYKHNKNNSFGLLDAEG